MDSKLLQHDNFTFIFAIPNVSHLLIYKDHWNDSQTMRAVIAEVIEKKWFEKLYWSNQPKKFTAEDLSHFEDAAIISLRIYGLQALNYSVSNIGTLFSKELRNQNNVIHFDNERLSLEKNVSTIDISIRICESLKNNEQADTSAA